MSLPPDLLATYWWVAAVAVPVIAGLLVVARRRAIRKQRRRLVARRPQMYGITPIQGGDGQPWYAAQDREKLRRLEEGLPLAERGTTGPRSHKAPDYFGRDR